MTPPPDRQRRQVYIAEDLASEHTVLDAVQDHAWLVGVVEQIVGSSWWRSVGGGQGVAVKWNRSRYRSHWDPIERRISLSPEAMTLSTILHEMAHALVTDTGRPDWSHHGPQFRGAHVALRKLVLGATCAGDLVEVYRQFGLAVEPFHWSEVTGPPLLDQGVYDDRRIVGRPGRPSQPASGRPPIAL